VATTHLSALVRVSGLARFALAGVLVVIGVALALAQLGAGSIA
jgi:hypothetical protein